MNAFLDANVLLDSMLERVPFHVDADAILKAADSGKCKLMISTLSLANAHYVGRRVVGDAQARADIHKALFAFEVLSVDRQAILEAEIDTGSDFEDNIQISVAVRGGAQVIVTRDPSGFVNSPLPVMTPIDFLRSLNSENSN